MFKKNITVLLSFLLIIISCTKNTTSPLSEKENRFTIFKDTFDNIGNWNLTINTGNQESNDEAEAKIEKGLLILWAKQDWLGASASASHSINCEKEINNFTIKLVIQYFDPTFSAGASLNFSYKNYSIIVSLDLRNDTPIYNKKNIIITYSNNDILINLNNQKISCYHTIDTNYEGTSEIEIIVWACGADNYHSVTLKIDEIEIYTLESLHFKN